ncbi:amidohydrolase family protein [Thalassotalea litorea]|uniref:amidohydrolase family protein n=1 Tax=Thalassotalea litorea TaxID=2020715 RepID=UPI003736F6FF
MSKSCFLFIVVAAISWFSSSQVQAFSSFDLVIRNGRVIDPDSGLDAIRNIGINGKRIAVISENALEGDKVIDASGQVVAPGFIDLHHHGQNITGYRMQAVQGVTTALELESGVLPIDDWYRAQKRKDLPIHYGASVAWTFARISVFTDTKPEAELEYFQNAQGEESWKQEIADKEQFKRLMGLVEEGLKDGALGIGINAGYAPGYGQKEYFALSKLAAKYKVATFTHVRYASNSEPQSSFEAVKELIANAALTGTHMHICHINSTSLRDINATLELFNKAIGKGIPVSAGTYPWGAASTVAGAALFSTKGWQQKTGYQNKSIQYRPKRLNDSAFRKLRKNNPGALITWHFLDESKPEEQTLLDKSVVHDDVLIESDSMPWMLIDGEKVENYQGSDWPIPDNAFAHPRSSGSFVKVLQEYVRERQLMTLSEAINKMSTMPADILDDFVPQMKKKGRLQPGMDADIVIFNPDTVANRATYETPNKTPIGVTTVIVNGKFVVENEMLKVDAAPGKPIRRKSR